VGCRDSNLYALDAATGKEKWRAENAGSWVITSPAVTQGKVLYATSDSSLFFVLDAATGKTLLREQGKAYYFSSPSVAGDVAVVGVLNGSVEARDIKTGALLWIFWTETAKQNKSWVLTADGRLNGPLIFPSFWRETPLAAADRQFAIGAVFSSPLLANGVVYFGSTDGYMYALE
jgi:outer membrane protein assembly factor BamB